MVPPGGAGGKGGGSRGAGEGRRAGPAAEATVARGAGRGPEADSEVRVKGGAGRLPSWAGRRVGETEPRVTLRIKSDVRAIRAALNIRASRLIPNVPFSEN